MTLGTGGAGALSINEIESTIIADPELTLRILALSNSAFYSQQHEITTLRKALIVLGTSAVSNLAASLLARSLQASASTTDEALSRHSQAVGIAGQMLAEVHGRIAPAQAFAAGLLHDIGILALHNADLNVDDCSICHAALGSEVSARLGLSPSLCAAIGCHEDYAAEAVDDAPLIATVSVANALAIRAGYGYDAEQAADQSLVERYTSSLGLTDADIDTFVDDLPLRIEREQRLFDEGSGRSL
ncbi:MAG: HDOD domain-containing protein [Pseudomonadota bacterium]